MILNSIANKKDIIIKSIRDDLAEPEVISDILTWRMTNQTLTDIDLILDFNESVSLKELNFNIIAGTIPKVKLFYSYDGNTWNDFRYVSYSIISVDSLILNLPDNITLPSTTIVNKNDIINVLEKHEKNIISLYVHTMERQPLKGLTTPENEPISKQFHKKYVFRDGHNDSVENEILDFYLKKCYLNQESYLNLYYPFFNNDEYLYSNFYTNQIKFELRDFSIDNIVPALYFSKFIANISQEINNLEMSISPFTDNLFKQKAYINNPFLPDISKTFFEMLETSP